MNSYIASLKYAPGLAKEFSLMGQQLLEQRHDVQYMLSGGYSWLLDDMPAERISFVTRSKNSREMVEDTLGYPFRLRGTLRRRFAQARPDFLCMYNPHPLNFAVMQQAQRAYPSGTRAIYLHEPFKPDKRSFGRIGKYYFELVEQFQTLSIRYANTIIVPSPHAHELFEQRYPDFHGSVHIAPILIPEIARPEDASRRFISLVGTINKSRGLDTFINLINSVAERGLDWQFKIMTRNAVEDALKAISPAGQRLLTTVIKSEISDQEISDTVSNSYAVFLPHKQVTQSGNVPVCFRVGTPIIARNLAGFSQHVTHKQTGYLLPDTFTVEQLIDGIGYIRQHIDVMSSQARHVFETTFGVNNWTRYYGWAL